jgi:hypothetical protein
MVRNAVHGAQVSGSIFPVLREFTGKIGQKTGEKILHGLLKALKICAF